MSINQFSASWSQVEDRIHFSFNTIDKELFQFWLTRVVTRSLLDSAQITIEQDLSNFHNERSSKLISEFQKEGLKGRINFEEAFEGGRNTPLGENPILVSAIQIELVEQAATISMTLVNNQMVRFGLTCAQLQALGLLLERLAIQANWNITHQEIGENDGPKRPLINTPPQVH